MDSQIHRSLHCDTRKERFKKTYFTTLALPQYGYYSMLYHCYPILFVILTTTHNVVMVQWSGLNTNKYQHQVFQFFSATNSCSAPEILLFTARYGFQRETGRLSGSAISSGYCPLCMSPPMRRVLSDLRY